MSEARNPADPAPTLEQLLAEIDAPLGAEALAAGPAPAVVALDRYVVFSLGATRYAAPVPNVIEVDTVPRVAAVPNVPDWLLGVTNLRGDVVSVVDLRLWLGLGPPEPGEQRRIVVLHAGHGEITTCLLVDRVHGILRLARDAIQTPRAAGLRQDRMAPFLKGLCEGPSGVTAVLDVEGFLRSPEIRQFE